MNVQIAPSWQKVLEQEFEKEYFANIVAKVKEEYGKGTCYPPGKLIFNAFNLCPFDKVKVVIIGQDPYHEPGQAMGLSFSVPEGTSLPPSLQNIYKEIANDIGTPMHTSGDLSRWASQGVLLLNSTLTVRAHMANSHSNIGWQQFTDAVIRILNKEKKELVFMLWGGYARSKKTLIDANRHLILESVHPSPLSANRGGWFNQHQFSACNKYLSSKGKTAIDW